jgi:hypothetical protein
MPASKVVAAAVQRMMMAVVGLRETLNTMSQRCE